MSQSLTILLTNDDGISAPGILAQERAFAAYPEIELWTVAPDGERSTCSHGMSLARPVYTRELGPRRIAVDGLPVDCVYLALFGIMPQPPDVVVSGINRGANLGCDVIFSGTVAAAREAALVGVHGLAVSLVSGDDFDRAAQNAAEIAIALAARPTDPALLLNLNYPAGPFQPPQFAPLGERNYPRVVSRRRAPLTGQTYYWLGGPAIQDERIENTDGWLIGQGVASATLLKLDQTDEDQMNNADALCPFLDTAKEP